MAVMDFPSSPTNGQIFGAYTYDSSKSAWRVTGVQATSVISSPTPPSSPTAGNLWLNTNDGVLFVYYTDADTSQWVEVKSNTASGSTVAARVDTLEAYPSGLVRVAPTSVTLSGGSASVSSSGRITVTGPTSYVALNGVLKSGYDNYKVIFNLSSTSGATEVRARLRSATTDDTSANYMYNFQNAAGSTYGAVFTSTDTSFQMGRSNGTTGARVVMEFLSPNLTQWTNITAMSADGVFASITTGVLKTTTAYDGITLMNNVTINNAVIDVYGYRN